MPSHRTEGHAPIAVALGSLVALALASAGAPLHAQSVEGTVTDPSTGNPVSGAVVVLFAEPDRSMAAGMFADDAGRFRLRAPAAGSYRLAVQRMGYRTTETPTFELDAGQALRLDLEAPVQPIRLEEIRVVGRGRCGPMAEDRRDAFLLWEEARKALVATVVAEAMDIYRFDLVLFERQLEPRRLRVVEEVRREREGRGRHPFRSARIEKLVVEGYVEEDRDGVLTFHAPDHRGLLTSAFSESYCFRLVQGEGGEVGIGFEPLPERRLPDIRGTLWMDGSTAGLRRLEYEYVNLPLRVRSRHAGGLVEFDRLPDGGWIVRSWAIRMPRIERVRPDGFGAIPGRGAARHDELRLTGVKEDAAEVRAVRTAAGDPVRVYEDP